MRRGGDKEYDRPKKDTITGVIMPRQQIKEVSKKGVFVASHFDSVL